MSEGKILVVDDNEMNRDMLSRRLQRQKYDVDVAENGARCIEMMRSGDYDLVLLDIMMPRMNGYEVLQAVKVDDVLKHIPIIMISAVDDLDSVVKCIEMGAEDYLFKPFNPVLLKARVGASLDKKRQMDSERSDSVGQPATDNGNDNPVEIILSSVDQLQSGELGHLNPEQSDVLDRIAAAARQINTD